MKEPGNVGLYGAPAMNKKSGNRHKKERGHNAVFAFFVIEIVLCFVLWGHILQNQKSIKKRG
jgi:hypothetical protein